jgi:hypothetical protein
LGRWFGQQWQLDRIQYRPGGGQAQITERERLADRVREDLSEQGGDGRPGVFAIDPAAYTGGVGGDLGVASAFGFCGYPAALRLPKMSSGQVTALRSA